MPTTTPPQLPHAPYITAVTDALTAAGLDPTEWWISDSEIDRYRTDDDGATMLTAVLLWDDDHPALNRDAHDYGIALFWEGPAEEWQWAPRRQSGGTEQPDFLPTLGRYSDPSAVVTVVRALLSGEPLPEGHAPYWHPADSVRTAVEAWTARMDEAAHGSL